MLTKVTFFKGNNTNKSNHNQKHNQNSNIVKYYIFIIILMHFKMLCIAVMQSWMSRIITPASQDHSEIFLIRWLELNS